MESLRKLSHNWKVWLLSAAAGALLGCIFRLLFGSPIFDKYASITWIMTLAFLAVVPFSMGYFSVKHYLQNAPAEHIR